ncbi:MAG: hypothetical protein Q9219_006698 [cf. Caloplaca sp. 3 TL-2023]
MVASGVWAGEIPLEKAHNLKEVGNAHQTMKQELSRIGYLGPMDASYKAMPLGAHFELHIGKWLPSAQLIQTFLQPATGYGAVPHTMRETNLQQLIWDNRARSPTRWHTINVAGQECHTGTTDFANRADALLTAAKLILHSHKVAARKNSLASTGIIRAEPGSTNTVPGRVQFSLDIRAGDDETLDDMEQELVRDFDKIARDASIDSFMDDGVRGRPCSVEWVLDAPSSAIKFDNSCIDCVRRSAEELFGEQSVNVIRDIISGAGKFLLKP